MRTAHLRALCVSQTGKRMYQRCLKVNMTTGDHCYYSSRGSLTYQESIHDNLMPRQKAPKKKNKDTNTPSTGSREGWQPHGENRGTHHAAYMEEVLGRGRNRNRFWAGRRQETADMQAWGRDTESKGWMKTQQHRAQGHTCMYKQFKSGHPVGAETATMPYFLFFFLNWSIGAYNVRLVSGE